MKLLYMDWTLPYLLKDATVPVGGWAVELANWIAGLQAVGVDVEVLTWQGAGAYIGKPVPVKLREAYRRHGGVRVLKYFYHHIPSLVAATCAARPDVVIQACAGIETAMLAYAARRAGALFVHRLANDCDVDDRISIATRAYERLAFRWGMERTDAILCQNGYQAERVRALWPERPQTTLHNPFGVPASWGALGSGPRSYIAWIANFGPAKNVPLLARIAAANSSIQFRVAGGMSGLATSETLAAVEKLRELPNVELVGYLSRQDVPGFLAGARYLLTTSLYEGFSNTFLEALALGTPLLVPARVDPDGIVGRFGLGRVAATDEELLQLPAAAMAMQSQTYREVSARCRDYVLEAHEPAALARKLVTFLDEQLRRPAVSGRAA